MLLEEVRNCTRCPRLTAYRQEVARVKRRAFFEETYWGKPISGVGDLQGRVLIIGLAPAAHGGNRTGRIFTGDRSGDFLIAAMYRAGFANQPTSIHREDGLTFLDAYVSLVVRCAPPDNRPLPEELRNCLPYLGEERRLMGQLQVVLALGQYAWQGYLRLLGDKTKVKFGHGAKAILEDGTLLVGSYHPSQQNTQTGRLTSAMMDHLFTEIKDMLHPV